ncbi:MAG: glycerate kinase [Oscillospiraceae bacterium]|jgi:hydroxypyruvate reductase|nr:glycerate kinase [Oscillospiraceae bacterium]
MSIIADAHTIIDESIKAVLPDAAVRRALSVLDLPQSVVIVAIGKAAWRMARTAADALGSRVRSGLVVTKYGHAEGPIPHLEIIEAGHPIPDANSVLGARKALDLVSGLTARDAVLFLVSGGGSALFEQPLPGVALEDTQTLTKRLLTSGADITQINTIRKHLSAVKGGRFAKACEPAQVFAIILSDVLGDSLDSIASGPAVPDSSTSRDALAILDHYRIPIPDNARRAISIETPKTLGNTHTMITGNVEQLCTAASIAAERMGYTPLILTTTLDCEAREAGAAIAAIAREIHQHRRPAAPPCAVILGGETVVRVRGSGLGGRSQELSLAASKGVDGLPGTVIFSVGSDGTDGPTDAAGGIVTGEFAQQCRDAGVSIDAYLGGNDAYHILQRMGGLIMTGPTGTNVNDLTVLLIR